ncbi:ankyrin repeat-containing domain protein [Mycena leptocephala]|nr:ankyrin repeat-containing domain protein [Mycena leptocephala]
MSWRWNSPPWNCPDWPSKPSALWIAAAANLLETATFLLEEAPHLDNQEISVASYYGHLQIVQLLVDHDANVNALGGRLGNALQAASDGGHINIVQLLIEHSADVNAQGGEYGNALQAASSNGHINIVQLLIEHGADVNAQGGEYESALQAAFEGGHINIVQFLIEQGADVNAQCGDFGNPLQAASFDGYINIVQLLIEQGANVNAQGGHFGNPLQAASLNGHMNIVQLLIEHGADPSAQGGYFGNALQAALYKGHIDIVQFLIEYGADVNAQGGFYRNSLQAASVKGYIDIVQLLIEQGADVHAQGGEYGSALQAASFRGHMDIVQLLIEHGADVHAQGGNYGSALKAALYRGIDREWQLDMDDDNTLIQRLENIAQQLRDNGAHEEDLDALTDDTSEHEGQSTDDSSVLFTQSLPDPSHHLAALSPHDDTDSNSNSPILPPALATSSPACPKLSFVRRPKSSMPRVEDVSVGLRWPVNPASALRVLLPPAPRPPNARPPPPLARVPPPPSTGLVVRPELVPTTQLYLKDPGDLALLASSVVLFSFLRLVLSHMLFPMLVRKRRIRKAGKVARFGEQGYAVVYFAAVYTLSRETPPPPSPPRLTPHRALLDRLLAQSPLQADEDVLFEPDCGAASLGAILGHAESDAGHLNACALRVLGMYMRSHPWIGMGIDIGARLRACVGR